MKPIPKRKTAKESVYDELKEAILGGKIKSDEILTETMLSEMLKISRTPIREAVADLTNEGLLVHIPRKGFHVPKISISEIEQITFLRVSIECEGLLKLVPVITERHILQLKSIIAEQEEAMEQNNRIKYIELDQDFHRQILKFSNQNLLEEVLLRVYNLTRLIGHNALMKDGRMAEVLDEHRGIIQALEEKDDKIAIKLMKAHLEMTTDIVKKIN
ncbi:GntR family transcriptional regulator [Virgibacillus proomii]|uniref:GntR family transcriptional regulator n=1 Tax=Virgibacillus proomii TaxID=84407 RepID=UPI001C107481|nr:GntR family transcriptional regulator [Virgibacillus proomii]MBU5266760.1 GntR family transcriptional regulator [Virgibacillus proomii]